MRKVKFTQQNYNEKLSHIIEDFPVLDDIHPFYADLLNVLYDRDHYKLALGQVNMCRALIDNLGRDYVKLIKYGDSLYRCKQLKRAALGRMCTLMRKQKSTLAYLEEVRKHLARLPSIDPNTRTLLVCGFPNVGKSSFMNKVSRANVDVQPYAFTTKSLFVGHMDFKYLRWQVIDTPGILDHSLEERNTIEMQAITALAHLQCSVLYFIDISEECGYTVDQQLSLFGNIRPLFAAKPLIMVVNKIDVQPWETLAADKKTKIEAAAVDCRAHIIPMSNVSESGVSDVKNYACEELLKMRVEQKVSGKRIAGVINRLTVTAPAPRDNIVREASIPDSVLKARDAMATGEGKTGARKRLQKDIEKESGGAGVYSMDYAQQYLLKKEEWKTDLIPETMDGKNIADFIDPDIMQKLEELEKEEEAREAEQAERDAAESSESDVDEEERSLVKAIRDKKKVIVQRHRAEKNHNRARLPRNKLRHSLADMKSDLQDVGMDTTELKERGQKRVRSLSRGPNREDGMDDDEDEEGSSSRPPKRSHTKPKTAQQTGLADKVMVKAAKKLGHKQQKLLNKMARAGEADRHHTEKMPKHLFIGKLRKGGAGKRDFR
jgi:nucleolar GTP-binding protein